MVTNIRERGKRVSRIILILLAINFILFLLKFIPSLYFESVSVRADAVNSLSDFLYGIILLLGVQFVYRPSDASHQHGHARFAPFLSLVIAASIFITGLFVFGGALHSFVYGYDWTFSIIFPIVLMFSILIKYTLYRMLKKKGVREEIDLLVTVGEDCRADVLASVVALVGVSGAYIGYVYFDVFFGLLISAYIIKISLGIAKKNFDYLTGASPSEEFQRKVRNIIESDDKIEVEEMKIHYVGPKLEVFTVITLPGNTKLEEVHQLEEEIKKEIKTLDSVGSIYFHVEPSP